MTEETDYKKEYEKLLRKMKTLENHYIEVCHELGEDKLKQRLKRTKRMIEENNGTGMNF